MNEYFCVFRMDNSAKSMTCTFQAENSAQAIKKLMVFASITNMMELDEAELLQIIKNPSDPSKIGYKPVLRKEKGGKAKVTLPHVPIPENPVPVEHKSNTPKYVAPYIIEVL